MAGRTKIASRLVVMLLVPEAWAQGVMSPCSAGATPCQHSCPNGLLDLSGFKAQMPAVGFFHYADAMHEQDYYFDACGPISAVTCSGTSVTVGPVAIQTFGAPAPQPPTFPISSCAVLGAATTQMCTGDGGSNFTCQYSAGDGERSVAFVYTCAAAYEPPTAKQPDPEVTPAHYVITFAGPAACAGAGGAHTTSWGTLFCILFPVGCVVYLAAGFYYNYKFLERRGADAIPQLEYWREVPGLVKDGCLFSYDQATVFAAYLRELSRGAPVRRLLTTVQPPGLSLSRVWRVCSASLCFSLLLSASLRVSQADAGLKTALADNEEGTTYEERTG